MTKEEKIIDFLTEVEIEELLTIHNEYCGTVSSENYIMYMEEFDDYMEGFTPLDIALTIFNGDFNPNDDYFTFNGYANLVSIHESDLQDYYIYVFDIARHCTENDDDLGNETIREILDEEEDIKLGWLNHTVKSIKDIYNIEEITYQNVERLYPSVREKIKEINKELIFKNEEFMED